MPNVVHKNTKNTKSIRYIIKQQLLYVTTAFFAKQDITCRIYQSTHIRYLNKLSK